MLNPDRFHRYDVATDEQVESAITVISCIAAAILLAGVFVLVAACLR
jgi:hypothetical protein